MANASETYQATAARPAGAGLSRKQLRHTAAIGAVAVIVVAFATIEPLRQAATHFFAAVSLFSAIVSG